MKGYTAEGICIDCGKVFTKHSADQIRCKECQEKYRKEYYAIKYRERKKEDDVVYRNGHPQVCTYTHSCYYGGAERGGCSYIIETGMSRVNQGHFIKDGKCDLYEPRNGRKTKRQSGNLYFGRRENGEDA